MLATLTAIRQRLRSHDYHHAEHVRLGLVTRLVQQLGWDIWNPREVRAELAPSRPASSAPLVLTLVAPDAEATAICIACVGAGGLAQHPATVEEQLHGYPHALFTLLTDGQHWHFYYSLLAGPLADKLFYRLDLLADEPAEAADHFFAFLHRDNVLSHSARHRAEAYLVPGQQESPAQCARPITSQAATPQVTRQPSLPAARIPAQTLDEAPAFLLDARPQPAAIIAPKLAAPLFLLQRPKAGLQAEASWLPAGTMRVLAGSTAAGRVSSSISAAGYELRQHLLQTGVLRPQEGKLSFDQDYEFDSPNRAAEVVCGGTVNARVAWLRAGSGQTLGSYLTSNPMN